MITFPPKKETRVGRKLTQAKPKARKANAKPKRSAKTGNGAEAAEDGDVTGTGGDQE